MSKKSANVDLTTGEMIDTNIPGQQWPTGRLLVKTQYNKHFFPDYYEENNQPSETVPNQTLSIKTILDRYARGLPITGNNSEPEYYGEELMPDLKTMDISEIHDLKSKTADYIATERARLQTEADAKRQADHDKSINDEVEKRIKAKTESKKSEPKE